ncbi:MAG: AI-2E family transporter [bacterium]
MERNRRIVAGVAVFLVFAAFLWTTHGILSPILTGGLLLYLLMGLREYGIARRLVTCVILILLVWFVTQARGMLFPFFAAFILAYLFDPLVDLLERIHVPRTLATFFLLFFTAGVLVLVGMILIPNLMKEIQELIGRIDKLPDKVVAFVQKDLPRLLGFLNIDPQKLKQILLAKIPSNAELILSNLLKGVTGVGVFFGQIVNVVLIPVLTFYFLKDLDRIRGWAMNFVPRRHRSLCTFYMWRMNRILGGYLRGQIIVCTIVGVLTGLGLAVFHLPFAILLGVTTGILNIIPFIGLYVSLALALLTGFFTPDVLASMIKIGGVFLVVQMVEAYVISPKIVGERVGLHPVAVIFSILIFSRFLGLWGLIIGVPTAAAIKFLMDEWKRRQKWREMLVEKTVAKS